MKYQEFMYKGKRLLLSVLKSALIAVSVLAAVLVCNRIALPLYQDALARDITLEVIATGESNEAALANNVRLRDISVNGVSYDLSKITLEGDWAYSGENAFLYLYNTHEAQSVVWTFPDVLQMDLTFVREVGSGVVDIVINGRTWKSLDLYKDCSWETETTAYITNPLTQLEQNTAACCGILAAAFVLSLLMFLLCKEPVSRWVWRVAVGNVLAAGLSAVLFLFICVLQYRELQLLADFFRGNPLVAFEGYIVIYLCMLLLFAVSHSWAVSFGVAAGFWEILLVISHLKETAKGVPLLPWDYQMSGEALSVVGNYDLSLSPVMWAVLGASVLILGVLILADILNKSPRKKWLPELLTRGLPALAVAAVAAIFVNTTVLCGIWATTDDSRVYQIGEYYRKNGFVVAFLEYTNYLNDSVAPEGYTEEALTQLSDRITDDQDATAGNRPNVIVVMSESFWDVTRLENVQFQEDPLPNYRQLLSESAHGDMLCHVFGGNTVVSEFECLTGFSGTFFPTDYMVYGNAVSEDFFSAVSILKAQGYNTLAVHPYLATNYNRNVAYSAFGFDEMLFEEDFQEDAERIRGYISDRAVFNVIREAYEENNAESDAPLFTFCITMQNHGGYWGSSLYEAGQVPFTAEGYNDTTLACMNDYFAGLHASDEALGELIAYFREQEEETVIIYFGDHMSDAGGQEEKLLSKESWYDPATFGYAVESHTVPFLIWSNRSHAGEELGLREISQLLPTAFRRQGIAMPGFWEYLLELQDSYAASNSALFVRKDLTTVNKGQAEQEIFWFRREYELLQYDYIWGERYAAPIWELS